MDATFPDGFLLPTDQEIPRGRSPTGRQRTWFGRRGCFRRLGCFRLRGRFRRGCLERRPGAAVPNTKYVGPGAVLAGNWNSGKAEPPIHLIKKGD